MPDTKDVLKYENILPEDFDGTFYFTNFTDHEFVGIWGGKEYHYPAQATSPMIMPEYSPLEVQNIRKKFAKDLAEQEFYRGDSYKVLQKQERNDDGTPRSPSIFGGGFYSEDQLVSLIQRCLEPLPIKKAEVNTVPKMDIEASLKRDEEGNTYTEPISSKVSLVDKAKKA